MWWKEVHSNGCILRTEDQEQRDQSQDRSNMEPGGCSITLEEKNRRLAESKLMQKREGRVYGNEDHGIF